MTEAEKIVRKHYLKIRQHQLNKYKKHLAI